MTRNRVTHKELINAKFFDDYGQWNSEKSISEYLTWIYMNKKSVYIIQDDFFIELMRFSYRYPNAQGISYTFRNQDHSPFTVNHSNIIKIDNCGDIHIQ